MSVLRDGLDRYVTKVISNIHFYLYIIMMKEMIKAEMNKEPLLVVWLVLDYFIKMSLSNGTYCLFLTKTLSYSSKIYQFLSFNFNTFFCKEHYLTQNLILCHLLSDINECESLVNPCKNGGTCQNTYGSYICICPPEWTGKDCGAGM